MRTPTNKLLRSWQIAMIAESLSERTIEERVRLVESFADRAGVDPVQATPESIIVWLSKAPSAATRHAYYVNLHAWFRWLVIHDHRDDDPMIKVRVPKRPKYKPRPSLASHVAAVLDSGPPRIARTAILFGALAGLRVSEITRLHDDLFDVVEGRMTVHGKGGRVDVVPIHPVLIEEAKYYLALRRGYWFPARVPSANPHMHRHTIRRAIVDAFDSVGVTMNPHQLRHFFGTALLAAGVDSRVVQTLMRHENLSTTALYMEVNVEQQVEALAKLDFATAFKALAA